MKKVPFKNGTDKRRTERFEEEHVKIERLRSFGPEFNWQTIYQMEMLPLTRSL